jgi:hypothetical protein
MRGGGGGSNASMTFPIFERYLNQKKRKQSVSELGILLVLDDEVFGDKALLLKMFQRKNSTKILQCPTISQNYEALTQE